MSAKIFFLVVSFLCFSSTVRADEKPFQWDLAEQTAISAVAEMRAAVLTREGRDEAAKKYGEKTMTTYATEDANWSLFFRTDDGKADIEAARLYSQTSKTDALAIYFVLVPYAFGRGTVFTPQHAGENQEMLPFRVFVASADGGKTWSVKKVEAMERDVIRQQLAPEIFELQEKPVQKGPR